MTERERPAQPAGATAIAVRFGVPIGQAPSHAGLGSDNRAASLARLAFALLIVPLTSTSWSWVCLGSDTTWSSRIGRCKR
jgi:hypothetical protein